MNIEQLYQLFEESYFVDTDTRKIRKGSLFFALKGDHFNGNEFALTAIKNGAKYAIIDEEKYHTHSNTILVSNVLETLQSLANFHRKKLNTPILSLTGSNGKTTTKELINAVLAKKYNTIATIGNLNNHIGVPLTLLNITKETELAIIEMGANHLHEIATLCKIAEPNFGYITNFGKAHLEGFGGVDGVIKGKSELYDFLRVNKGIAFVNVTDTLQMKQSEGVNTIPFGNTDISLTTADPFVKVKFKTVEINSHLIGNYNYNNIAAAICIGNYFNVPLDDIKKGIENYIPSNNRSQIIEKGTNKIILDAYNANPSSMAAALENFHQLNETPKVVFLGDMFELGKESLYEHQKIGELVSTYQFDTVYLIGKAFSTIQVKNAFVYDSFDAFKASNYKLNITNSTILIKGSRGMALERLLELF